MLFGHYVYIYSDVMSVYTHVNEFINANYGFAFADDHCLIVVSATCFGYGYVSDGGVCIVVGTMLQFLCWIT